MWLSLLQAWVFKHFRGIGNKDLWGGYQELQHPRAMMYLPSRGTSTSDEYREHLDQLDLASVSMAPYVEHRHACSFVEVSLYSGWLRYGTCKVRYLSKRVLLQFGHMQTIPDIHVRVHLFR